MNAINFSSIVGCLYVNVLWTFIIAAATASNYYNSAPLPSDVLEEIIEEIVDLYGIKGIKRAAVNDNGGNAKKKRKYVKYDRKRAYECVTSDWMAPIPRFDDKQFERTFRIRRSMVDYIIGHLAREDTFWTQTIDSRGKLSIHPHVKFCAAQKMMCYGVSFSAFKDYFQMGESTARLCMSKLSRGIVECPEIAEVYLRNPSKSDARRIAKMHKEVHGINGMMGSLDVTKIPWQNCPAAWKGQFVGKEGVPTLGLEAVADYNLWIWHSAFGFPGSLNDINIWERSPLLEMMQDGTHSEMDFSFEIDGVVFSLLYYLVDGIYPPLARFLSTISDPKTKIASHFAKNQEAFRKDVERAFGVLKIKFLCLKHPIRMHHRDDIFYVCLACIAMHNMMVEARIESGQEESISFYLVSGDDTEEDNTLTSDENDMDEEMSGDDAYGHKFEMVQRRWEELYDCDAAKKLKTAVMNQLYKDTFGEEEFKTSGEIRADYNPLKVR